MKTNIKEINAFTRELKINVQWVDLENDYIQNYKKFKAKHSMRGYRPGKVPDNIITKKYGMVIESNFTEEAINKFYKKALDELQLHPINQAEIKDLKFKKKEDLQFSAIFEITPNFELPKYENKFKINPVFIKHTENDIDESLINLQKKYGTIKKVSDGARMGHFIEGDFQELDEGGLPIVGKKHPKQYICLGEGVFSGSGVLPLEGIKSEEKVKVKIDYGESKIINYEVLVNKVEEQILPELNDEFAKTVDPNFKTLDELKSKLEENIIHSLDEENNKQVEKQISNYFVEKSNFEVPNSMREKYLNNMIDQMKKQNNSNDSINEDELRKMYKTAADWNIRWYLIKNKIINKCNFKIDQNEIKMYVEKAIKNSNLSKKQIKSFYSKPENRHKIQDDLINLKLYNYLKEYAIINEVVKSTDEVKKERIKNG